MERSEIYKHINDSANYYLRLLGDAVHMEYTDNGVYAKIRPITGEKIGTSVFNIRVEHLADAELQKQSRSLSPMTRKPVWHCCRKSGLSIANRENPLQ